MNKTFFCCVLFSLINTLATNVIYALSNCYQSQIILTNNVVTKGFWYIYVPILWKNIYKLQQVAN